jgi:hypothetical protein
MTCHGNCSRDGSRRGIFLRNSLSVISISSTPCDEVAAWCPSTRPILELLQYAPHQVTQKLKVKKFEFGLIVRIHILLRVPGVLDRRRGVGCVGSHTTSATSLVERTRASRSVGPTTVGYMGKAHRIYAVVNNCQAEHQSTVLKTSGTIADQTLSILIYPGATESFILGAVLKRIKVKAVKQDDFIFVEMASGAKQKVGGRVMGCILNLGDFVTRANLYVMILGSYDVVIGMDWLESHEAILKCKMKWLSLVDDEGQRHVIVGWN